MWAGAVSAGTLLSGAGAAGSLLGGTAALLSATKGAPKPPAVPQPPIQPTFAAGLRGGANSSLAALSPGAANGGTGASVFAPATQGQGKSLLGQ